MCSTCEYTTRAALVGFVEKTYCVTYSIRQAYSRRQNVILLLFLFYFLNLFYNKSIQPQTTIN